MDAAFRAKLADFRAWSAGQVFDGCRLVRYAGVELLGAESLPAAATEPAIERLTSEGFYVDWAAHAGRLYLRVWEFGGPEPDWPKVFAEAPLVDLAAMLGGISQAAQADAAADGRLSSRQ